MVNSKQREELADYAHTAWAGWMEYMFHQCHINLDKSVTIDKEYYVKILIPKTVYDRWQQQMNTAYGSLSEKEKESDRDEADKMLAIMK